MKHLTNEFLSFAWCSLTSGQRDLVKVKYYLARNQKKTLEQTIKGIENLELNNRFIRSDIRIHKIRVYEIPVIIDNMRSNSTL